MMVLRSIKLDPNIGQISGSEFLHHFYHRLRYE